ncbi:hypothetical protein AB0N14_04570 [Streptomyces sp. NPDC051104]
MNRPSAYDEYGPCEDPGVEVVQGVKDRAGREGVAITSTTRGQRP